MDEIIKLLLDKYQIIDLNQLRGRNEKDPVIKNLYNTLNFQIDSLFDSLKSDYKFELQQLITENMNKVRNIQDKK